jgi:hypothetical protein
MGFLKKLFKTSNQEKIKFEKFNPNNKSFGEEVLKYFQKSLSENTTIPVKKGWTKNEKLPLITITKSMDEIQKLYKKKLVSFAFDIWCNDKKTRDLITNEIITLIKRVDFGNNFSVEMNNEPLTIKINVSAEEKPEIENEVIIDAPQILTFEEKRGIYRSHFGLVLRVKVNVDKRELRKLQEHEEKCKFFSELVMGKLTAFGGELLESNNGEYALFKPRASGGILALIKNKKILWTKQFQNLISFDFARDGSYAVVATQLTKKEMPKGYKSGGHIYLVTNKGKIKDIKIPCDGLSCSISPDGRNFGITTMGPEWGVYYFDNKGKLIWKKILDKRIGGIELTNSQIVLYDKIHKETRKKIMELDKRGE